MPVEETLKLKIKCDNPDCPGNDLDPTVRTGWLFISSEVYGDTSRQTVFCSIECVSAATATTPTLLVPDPTPVP